MDSPDQTQGEGGHAARPPGRLLDILGIYVLPLVCFGVDYALDGIVISAFPFSIWVFSAAGMIAFRLSIMPGPASLMAGIRAALMTGATGSLLIGILLSPISALALMPSGLGLLGLVPFLTAHRLLLRARKLPTTGNLPFTAGVLAILAPSAGMLSIEGHGILQRQQDLVSGDPQRVLQALSPTAFYAPRDLIIPPGRRMKWTVCRHSDTLPLQDKAVETAVRAIVRAQDEPIGEHCRAFLSD